MNSGNDDKKPTITEQVAFMVANVVPGIDFTNDPLLQARLFSYLDTQLLRLGGPNFAHIPINRPVVPVHNHQHDGIQQQKIPVGRAQYQPNSLGGGCPMMGSEKLGAFVHHAEKVDGHKIRERSESFKDHYSQATLFWNSLSSPEQAHIVNAFRFELAKVESPVIRQRVVDQLSRVDTGLAERVAEGIGARVPGTGVQMAKGAIKEGKSVDVSPALSMENTVKDTIKSRKIAFLVADGVNGQVVTQVKNALTSRGAQVDIVARALGTVLSLDNKEIAVDKSQFTVDSVIYDAVFVPGGAASIATLKAYRPVLAFLQDAFHHCKAIGASGEGVDLLKAAHLDGVEFSDAKPAAKAVVSKGVVTAQSDANLGSFEEDFVKAIAQHRHWEREEAE